MGCGPQQRTIAWHGLRACLPDDLEVIVRGNRHLVMEREYSPFLELRWQESGCRDSEEALDFLQKQARRRGHGQYRRTDLPIPLTNSEDWLALQTAAEDRQAAPTLLLKLARRAGYLVLGYLHTTSASIDLAAVFDSLHFPDETEQTLWSLQDFTIKLPGDLHLATYAFEPGTARLRFMRGRQRFTFARFSAVGARCMDSSLAELPPLLQPGLGASEVQVHDATVSWSTTPSIWRQITERLRRRAPFLKGRLEHLATPDKIKTLATESNTYIDDEEFDDLYESYVLV